MVEAVIKPRRRRRKRQKWEVGDYFLVPLLNGNFVIGQIVMYAEKALCSVAAIYYDVVVRSKDEAEKQITNLRKDEVIAAQLTTTDLLDWYDDYMWPIMCHGEVRYAESYFDIAKLRMTGIGFHIYGSGIIVEFLNAFYGMCPWDNSYDFDYYSELLISPDKRPSDQILKYKREFVYQDYAWIERKKLYQKYDKEV